MTIEKKITIIGIISVIITIVLFCIDSNPKNQSIFRAVFEFSLMALLLFGIIAMNYFAIAFCIRKIGKLFKRKAVK
jgi:hypothetical protein